MDDRTTWGETLRALEDRCVELLGAAGPGWVERCEANVRDAVSLWGLRELSPLVGGRGGLVLRADTAAGVPVVLKAPIIDPTMHIAAQSELAEAGVGPRVLGADVPKGLLLLEYVDGRPLSRPADRAAQLSVVEVLLKLHAHEARYRFPLISDWLRSRLSDEHGDRTLASGVPNEHRRARASRTLADLDAGYHTSVFIHADLNVGNLLMSATGTTTLIDARGVLGDPAYDYALLAVKTSARNEPPRRLEQLAAELAGEGGCDRERAAAWVEIIQAAMV